MPAGEVALLVAFIAAAIAGIGASAFKFERRRVRKEWRRREGRDNRDRAVDDHEMVCGVCEKSGDEVENAGGVALMPAVANKGQTAQGIARRIAAKLAGFGVDTLPAEVKRAPNNETSAFFYGLAMALSEAGVFEKYGAQHYFHAAWATWLGFTGQAHEHAAETDVEFGKMIRRELDAVRKAKVDA